MNKSFSMLIFEYGRDKAIKILKEWLNHGKKHNKITR